MRGTGVVFAQFLYAGLRGVHQENRGFFSFLEKIPELREVKPGGFDAT